MLVTDCHCCVIDQTWDDIARVAWAGYLNDGRGLVRVDAPRGNEAVARPLMLYQPLATGLTPEEADLVQAYDPTREVIVVVTDHDGRHACKASHLDWTPPAAYAHTARVPILN